MTLPSYGQLYFEPASDGIDRATIHSFIETSNGDILAGTSNRVWRLAKGSSEWQQTSFRRTVHVMTQLPSGTLLAGTDRGIYRSTDNGSSWRQRYNVPGVGDFGTLKDGTIIAVDRMGAIGATRHFYYQSTDDGLSWEIIVIRFGTMTGTNVVGIDNLLFSGSVNGVKVSYNKGELWETTNLTDTVAKLIVTSNGVLVATAGSIDTQYQIYESHDTGRSWILVDSVPVGFTPVFGSIEGLSPGRNSDYYVSVKGMFSGEAQDWNGIWQRRSGQSGWKQMISSTAISTMNFSLKQPWVGADYSAWTSDNNGDDWKNNSKGLRNFSTNHLIASREGTLYTLAPTNKIVRQFYTIPTYGLFRSTDHAVSWELITEGFSNEVLTADQFGNLYSQRETVVVEEDMNGNKRDVRQPISMVSTDGGSSWQTLHPELNLGSIRTDASGIIAVRFEGTNHLFQPTYHPDLAISRDSGRSWIRMSDPEKPWEESETSPEVRGVTILANGIILVSSRSNREETEEDQGLYSIDTDYAVEKLESSFRPYDLWTSPLGDVIGVGDYSDNSEPGIHRSLDNGESWERYYDESAPTVITEIGKGFLSSHRNGGAYLFSNDNGASWIRQEQAFSKVVIPTIDSLYGLAQGSLLRSLNNGELWTSTTVQGVTEGGIYTLATTPSYLFAGSDGVYRRTMTPPSSVHINQAKEDQFALSIQSTSDPEHVVASFVLERPGQIQLTLYDLLGRKVQSIINDYREQGKHHEQIATHTLGHGTYLLVLQTESSTTSITISLR